MPFYESLGSLPRKRHTVFRKPGGGLYAEELMGHEGFVGTSSLLYHIHPPTTVKSARRLREIKWEEDDDTSLRHRHFLTGRIGRHGSATLDRVPLLFNSDIGMLYVEPDENDVHFYRNSQADECVYVVEGKGVLVGDRELGAQQPRRSGRGRPERLARRHPHAPEDNQSRRERRRPCISPQIRRRCGRFRQHTSDRP